MRTGERGRCANDDEGNGDDTTGPTARTGSSAKTTTQPKMRRSENRTITQQGNNDILNDQAGARRSEHDIHHIIYIVLHSIFLT